MVTKHARPIWQRNLTVLWFGVFMSGLAMSEVMPFLPLFVNQLGHFTKQQLTFNSSIIYAVSFIIMALTAPMWGRLADRKGRRLMLIRAVIGLFIYFILINGFCHKCLGISFFARMFRCLWWLCC